MAPFHDRSSHPTHASERAGTCRACPQRVVCFGRIFCPRQQAPIELPHD